MWYHRVAATSGLSLASGLQLHRLRQAPSWETWAPSLKHSPSVVVHRSQGEHRMWGPVSLGCISITEWLDPDSPSRRWSGSQTVDLGRLYGKVSSGGTGPQEGWELPKCPIRSRPIADLVRSHTERLNAIFLLLYWQGVDVDGKSPPHSVEGTLILHRRTWKEAPEMTWSNEFPLETTPAVPLRLCENEQKRTAD